MRTPVASSITAAAALALFVFSASAPAQYQDKGMPKGDAKSTQPVVHKPIPRTADGKPDMSGTWQGGGVSITGEAGAPPLHPLPPSIPTRSRGSLCRISPSTTPRGSP